VEITSRYEGVVKKLHYEAGAMAKVGSALVDIDTKGDGAEDAETAVKAPPDVVKASDNSMKPPAPTSLPAINAESSSVFTFATPAVRRLAKEKSIDLSKVTPTGKGGRILKEDVISFIEKNSSITTTGIIYLSFITC
jgi:2-oxoisovalerate dehydrogenase E2 component (dihydrolipoyl transacylase)